MVIAHYVQIPNFKSTIITTCLLVKQLRSLGSISLEKEQAMHEDIIDAKNAVAKKTKEIRQGIVESGRAAKTWPKAIVIKYAKKTALALFVIAVIGIVELAFGMYKGDPGMQVLSLLIVILFLAGSIALPWWRYRLTKKKK